MGSPFIHGHLANGRSGMSNLAPFSLRLATVPANLDQVPLRAAFPFLL